MIGFILYKSHYSELRWNIYNILVFNESAYWIREPLLKSEPKVCSYPGNSECLFGIYR